jgi:PAS domain S-box-containing protein
MMQDTDLGQGIQTFVSDEWPGITGRSRKELMDTSFFDLLHPDDRDEAVERYTRLMSGSVINGLFEMRLVGNGGSEVYIELTSGSSTYQGQRAVVSFIRDVSERKRAEAALRDTVAALTRSNTELQQFAYVASHDLQEPLRMVGSYVQLLSRRYRGKLDDDADDFIDFAVDGARRMQRMINDLLTYSRVGTRGGDFRETSFEDIFRQAVDNMQLAVEESGATVTHDPLPAVSADESQVVQLLQNLLGNAIKFHSEAPPRIHISARREDAQWLFSVADNGVGIRPDDAERIFQIFQRAHNGSHPGTGIGLAICRRVVERHDGHIWVESEVGKGSTFYFTMPATHGGS